MSFTRYARTSILNFGEQYGTCASREAIQSAIKNGRLGTLNTIITRGRERLDTIAGAVYGDGSYWWVLAAASNIGWGMQIPPGTIIYVPDLARVAAIIG